MRTDDTRESRAAAANGPVDEERRGRSDGTCRPTRGTRRAAPLSGNALARSKTLNPRPRNPNLTSSSELEKMSERKGLLSEQLSAAVRDSPKLRRVSFGREKNHAEIKMIFSQQEKNHAEIKM